MRSRGLSSRTLSIADDRPALSCASGTACERTSMYVALHSLRDAGQGSHPGRSSSGILNSVHLQLGSDQGRVQTDAVFTQGLCRHR